MNNLVIPDDLKAAKTLTAIIYGLYAASFLLGLTAIVAIIMNYVKREDMAGTFLESHFRWQIRTFWYGLLWMVVGYFTLLVLVGWAILFANTVWIIYRLVKGGLRLYENRPMYPA